MVGKGRAPCCDRTKVKRGPWSPAEDFRLITYIQEYGHSNWRALPKQAGLLRCGKSCRLRWINYLRPDVKRGNFSKEEEETVIRLQKSMGNKWSKIASQLPGRTDNEIKNVWNTHLKKKLGGNDATCDQNQSKDSPRSYSSSSSSSSSCISYGDLNLDKGPEIQEPWESVAGGPDDQKQDDKFSAGIMQAQWKPTDQKEDSISPGHSNIASGVQSPRSIVDVSRPTEESISLPDSIGPSQVQNLMTSEAEEGMVADESIEIPFDSDIDIWSMLDSLNPIQLSEFQPEKPEVSEHESTNFGGGGADECKMWLKYLENELGLAGGTDKDCPEKVADEDLMMKTSDNELMFRPQINPATSNFPTWPFPPQDFGT